MALALPCLNEDNYNQSKIELSKQNYSLAIEVGKQELPEKEGTGGLQEVIVDRAITDFKSWLKVLD